MTTPLSPETTELPLRHSDPLSLALIIKVMLVTTLLLALVYIGLRFYAQRRGGIGQSTDATARLRCTQALRLSARTKVYLLKANGSDVLLTEHQGGVTLTVLAGPEVEPAVPLRDHSQES